MENPPGWAWILRPRPPRCGRLLLVGDATLLVAVGDVLALRSCLSLYLDLTLGGIVLAQIGSVL